MTCRPSVLVPLVAVVLGLGVACGDGERLQSSPEPRAPLASRPARPLADAARALAPFGTATVVVRDGRVSLRSHGAPRRDLLDQLALDAGFEIEFGEIEPREVTLVLDEVEPEFALARLLEGEPYRLEYRTDPLWGHVLAAVAVGQDSASVPELPLPRSVGADRPDLVESEAPSYTADESAEDLRPALARSSEPSPPAPVQPASPPGDERLSAEQLALLRSSEPEVRLEAVEDLSPTGEGEEELIEVLRGDRDATVRAAAAEQLEFALSDESTDALLDALGDGDARVVVEAIRALRMQDETVIPDLEWLLDHPDASVRVGAAEAIEYLE